MDNTNTQTNTQNGKFMDFVSRPTNNLHPKSPEKSKTLMRSSVNKPSADLRQKLSGLSTSVDDSLDESLKRTVEPKVYLHAMTDKEFARAKQNNRSDLISRFGPSPNPQPTKPQLSAQPQVQKQPEPTNNVAAQTPPPQTFNEPAKKVTSKSYESSHARPKKAKSSKRGKSLFIATASVFAILFAGGIFAYLNLNRLDYYVASSKAGFKTSMPGYNPSGYNLSNLNTGSGIIEAIYHDNSSKSYTLTEKHSNWDSMTLLQSYVLNAAGQNYQTAQTDGKIIYLYGNRNATWVSNGIWYLVSSKSLTDQQLVHLATST